MKSVRVLHVSTAHRPNDPRIAYRVIPTLAPHYELIAALPNVTAGQLGSARSIRLPYFKRVLVRLLLSHPLVLWHALRLRPALLHLYDPELLPIGRLIQWLLAVPVIYEVHENLYKKMAAKQAQQGWYLARPFRYFDQLARQHFYLIFTEHAYVETYRDTVKPHAIIYNYPLLPALEPFRFLYHPSQQHPEFFYIGGLSFERALDVLVASFAKLSERHPAFTVHLFGPWRFTQAQLEALPGYDRVRHNLRFYGYTDQRNALPHAVRATAGLALLKPVGDYPDSYPTKLFEYMALSLPVITADFPLYRNVVERHNCGFCIPPDDSDRLTEVLLYLIEHPDEARVMGERGRGAVERDYNWESEAQKLLYFYKQVLATNQSSV